MYGYFRKIIIRDAPNFFLTSNSSGAVQVKHKRKSLLHINCKKKHLSLRGLCVFDNIDIPFQKGRL